MKNTSLLFQNLTRCFIFSLALVLICMPTSAQNGIRLNTPDAYKGYTLCTSNFGGKTYLLDNCGDIVNTWNNTNPQYYCRLTEDGNLIYVSNNSIIERSWDNNHVNQATVTSSGLRLDYEVIKLENGNYLAASRRIKNSAFFDEIGWSPSVIKPDRVDGVVELSPNGSVVWEWNISDHTIQDKISSAPNFGNIAEHPELIDVNSISSFDWQFEESFMINSIDYNPELDQILLSVRKVNEIMVIDHSTTTVEARGSTGGDSGKGGDILYRWGNPQNYKQGSESDRKLYFQHNPNWVKYGEHKGKIIMYNNGLSRFVPGVGSMSSVHIIDPPIDNDGNYDLESGLAYEPSAPDVTIDEVTTGNMFYSGYTSGAQVLPNGNIYITVGQPSDFLEVETDGTLVWKYTLANSSYIYRTEQYAPDFPGFEGRDLTASGTVEFPSSTYNCELFTATSELGLNDFFKVQFEQSSNLLTVINLESYSNILQIRNVQGQLIHSLKDVNAGTQISLDHVSNGLYYITILDTKNKKKHTEKIAKF